MFFKILLTASLLGTGFAQTVVSAASSAASIVESQASAATSITEVTADSSAASSPAGTVVGTPNPAAPLSTTSSVPTGAPVPGNYTGPLRPQGHFSPPAGFMNDPNGMFVDDNGTWHLYYQYNPTGIVAGNQHWGHATSQDLYHWENQPIALFPPNNFTFVFSGSAVVDVNNTSGFFPNRTNGVVAIYTLAEYPGGQAGPQQQAIAYSFDSGFTFTPYAQNPVIASNSSQFRDPKVIWYEDHWVSILLPKPFDHHDEILLVQMPPSAPYSKRSIVLTRPLLNIEFLTTSFQVMVIAYAQEFAIGFFTSPNLIDWTPASNFSYHGLLGEQYECPNLVEVPVNGTEGETMYVLAISINPGAPLGGSITEYFIGDFNGTHFTEADGATRLSDFGKVGSGVHARQSIHLGPRIGS